MTNDAEKLGLPGAPTAPAPETPAAPEPPKKEAPGARPKDAAPPRPQRVRRVGTATMGAALILVGLAICVGLFWPRTDFTLLLKLSPLVLVALGVEVLVASAKKDVRLKYDFLSMIVCFLLIAASLGASCASWLFDFAGPTQAHAAQRVEQTLEQQTFELLQGDPEIDSLYYDVSLSLSPARTADSVQGPDDLIAGDIVYAHAGMTGTWADEATFAKACRRVIDAVLSTGVRNPRIQFEANLNDSDAAARYSLYISGPYQLAKSDGELAALVTKSEYVAEADSWMNADEKRAWENERLNEDAYNEQQRQLDELLQQLELAEQRALEAEMARDEAEAAREVAEAERDELQQQLELAE